MLKALHEKNHYLWFIGLSKIAEVLGETNDFSASTAKRKSTLSRILENQWCSSWVKYSQGKLRLHTTLKERPDFEIYLTLSNQKLRKAITRLQINDHKLHNETGRYNQKSQMKRTCPFRCEKIDNETHCIFECKIRRW